MALGEEETPSQNGAIAFEAFGVRGAVAAGSTEILERVRTVLPPGWRPVAGPEVGRRFEVLSEELGTFGVAIDGETISRGLELDLAVGVLDAQLRAYVGITAENVFIHAGVAAHHGRGIVIPGPSFAGKTTIVAALVRAGAVYYSDEFAVLDEAGRVRPYAKPLSIRDGSRRQTDHPIESFGASSGADTVPVGLIAVMRFERTATWNPRSLSAGEGAMALLANAIPARERPQQVMKVVKRAAANAVTLEGARGEADEVAPLLLRELERISG